MLERTQQALTLMFLLKWTDSVVSTTFKEKKVFIIKVESYTLFSSKAFMQILQYFYVAFHVLFCLTLVYCFYLSCLLLDALILFIMCALQIISNHVYIYVWGLREIFKSMLHKGQLS